jgi:hypothetical protein
MLSSQIAFHFAKVLVAGAFGAFILAFLGNVTAYLYYLHKKPLWPVNPYANAGGKLYRSVRQGPPWPMIIG